MPNVPSVLVVGGGITSAAVSRALRRQLPVESVTVWEALGSLGGRMHTERTSVLGAAGLADTGAQYVTVTDDAGAAVAHKPLYDQLVESGVLRPMTGRIEGKRSADGGGTNYVAPQGVATIVEHMFSSNEVVPSLGRQAVGLRRVTRDGSLRGCWEVSSSDGHCQSFDGVVLTAPIPELLELLDSGEGGAWLDAGGARGAGVGREELRAVQYSSRYALTLFFPPAAAASFAAELDWVSRYVAKEDDDALVYLCHDSAKRGGAPGGGPAGDPPGLVSLVAHTSVPYGIRTLQACPLP